MQKIDSALSNRLAKMSFICSLMVVALHGYCGPDWVHRLTGICDVAVPFFFLCSGFLFAGRMEERWWYWRQLRSRARSLLVPYVFWNVARWGVVAMIGTLAARYGSEYGTYRGMGISRTEWWRVCGLTFGRLPLEPFWFIRCLIVIVLLSPIIAWVRNKRTGLAFLSLVYFAAFWLVGNYDVGYYGGWGREAYDWTRAVFFFGTGVWLRFNPISVEAVKIMRILFTIIGAILLCTGSQVMIWMGIPVFMLGVWLVMDGKDCLKPLTSCAFPVYALHTFMGTIVGLEMRALGASQESALIWLVKISLMIVASLAFALLMKRFLPRFSQFVFGGR